MKLQLPGTFRSSLDPTFFSQRYLRFLLFAFFVVLAVPLSAIAKDTTSAWRVQELLTESERLRVYGSTRLRAESLNGQYRSGGSGSDQGLLARSLLNVEVSTRPVRFHMEIEDSRTWFTDSGSSVSTGTTNPLDFAQAYAALQMDQLISELPPTELKIGRMTLDIGSRRVVERNGFRNTLNTYGGAHLTSTWGAKRLELVLTTPVERKPDDQAGLLDNQIRLDRESGNRWLYGLFHQRPGPWEGSLFDIYLFGLHERDTRKRPTHNREYLIPGARLYLPPAPGNRFFEFEVIGRLGQRHATRSANDRNNLNVRALMIHLVLGRQWDLPRQPRLSIELDYASGDDDPNDGRYNQYDNLFGTRRGDFGHTSLHGPLRRANLISPALRFYSKLSARADLEIIYRPFWLASKRDAWIDARLHDPTGRSGQFVGHTAQGKLRFWLVPDSLRLEWGLAILTDGEFAREVPGNTGEGNTLFGYAQATFSF